MLASENSVLLIGINAFVSNALQPLRTTKKSVIFCLFETSEKITLALCLSDIDLDQIGLLKLNKTILNALTFCKVYLQYVINYHRVVTNKDSSSSDKCVRSKMRWESDRTSL